MEPSCVIICFNDELTSSEMVKTLMHKKNVLQDITNIFGRKNALEIKNKNGSLQFIDRTILCTECDDRIYRFEIIDFDICNGDY